MKTDLQFLGRKHDKFGNHVQWWSNQTINTFENLTKCFIDQYENFTIEGIDDHVSTVTQINPSFVQQFSTV